VIAESSAGFLLGCQEADIRFSIHSTSAAGRSPAGTIVEKRARFTSKWLPYLLVAPQIIITLLFFSGRPSRLYISRCCCRMPLAAIPNSSGSTI
jgi:hypothetical protein